jgi:hypothetical protein
MLLRKMKVPRYSSSGVLVEELSLPRTDGSYRPIHPPAVVTLFRALVPLAILIEPYASKPLFLTRHLLYPLYEFYR